MFLSSQPVTWIQVMVDLTLPLTVNPSSIPGSLLENLPNRPLTLTQVDVDHNGALGFPQFLNVMAMKMRSFTEQEPNPNPNPNPNTNPNPNPNPNSNSNSNPNSNSNRSFTDQEELREMFEMLDKAYNSPRTDP